MIKDYIIKSRLGIGSYGTVYKVCKKNTSKIYVIKQIPLLGLTEKQITEYKSEAKLLSSIKSNYVVKYFDSFIENHNLNILMEYCAGGDLFQYIEKNKKKKIKLKEKTIWQIFIQMIIGLHSIHKNKILHRDLKSQNIFLTKNLDIKIGDLGVSKKLIKTNFAKTFIGTPYYLSPEICMEKPYNDKSDIWAIGCILYELCTYNYPFNAKSQGALLLKILNNEPEKIDNNYYSKDLQNMINLLLNKNYELRPGCSDILQMKIILEKAKKYNINNDIFNEVNNINNNINNNIHIVKKESFKGNKKENNNSEKQINNKIKSNKNNFYFDCNERKPEKINNSNNKIIKQALSKIMKKQNNKKNNDVLLLLNDVLKGVDKKKIEIDKNYKKIKQSKSKEKKIINFTTEEKIQNQKKKIEVINIDKIISVDDNLIQNNMNNNIKPSIKDFANDLNNYVNKYKTAELKTKNKPKLEYQKGDEFNIIESKDNNVKINLNKKNKVINNNINININNDVIDNNKNIMNSIMNFKIINNNDSDIHININNNSNILSKNKSTLSEDINNKELYSEEENSEEQKESVKEIKENKNLTIEEINNEINMIKEKINLIKEDMLTLIGGTDYNYIINLYNSINFENNAEQIYEKIENFVNKYYDSEKKDNFNNLYYLLITCDCELTKKEKQLKSIL